MLLKHVWPHEGNAARPGIVVLGGLVVVVVAAMLDLDVVVELVFVAEVELVIFGLLVDVGLVVVELGVIEVMVEVLETVVEAVVEALVVDEDDVLEEVEPKEQFPIWHTPYPQNDGPVPHFPAALQQSPQTPAHIL